MALFESIFDILYLSLVIALAVQLVLQNDRRAKLFGLMGLVLGIGDAFHLLPRVISYWSATGFAGNAALLSWGKLVTSLTMTLFYLLYFHFLRQQTADKSKLKLYLIYGLALLRIVLTLLPQNQWGTMPGDYTFAILRNIPFAAMGLLLIIWSYQQRKAEGIKHMALLISLSFIFYLPVVLWVNMIPMMGVLMMPKTVAYFLIVYLGYRRFMPKFSVRNVAEMAFVYLIFGLAAGIFFREFSKAYDFSGSSSLANMHGHLIALGVIGLLIVYALLIVLQPKNPQLVKKMKLPLLLWHIGLSISVIMMMIKGMIEVLGYHYYGAIVAAVAGTAGIGHIVLGVALILSLKVVVGARY
ncbi:MAG: beta-carotene 15,15'-monooxygenase [Clostridiales bacterium]|nr:MAG: beta-carotene 15,15'-monooxygenase [Clostridiales bacterium]